MRIRLGRRWKLDYASWVKHRKQMLIREAASLDLKQRTPASHGQSKVIQFPALSLAPAHPPMIVEGQVGLHIYRADKRKGLVFLAYNGEAEKMLQLDHRSQVGLAFLKAWPGHRKTDRFDCYLRALQTGEIYRGSVDYEDDRVAGRFTVAASATSDGRLFVAFRRIAKPRHRSIFEPVPCPCVTDGAAPCEFQMPCPDRLKELVQREG